MNYILFNYGETPKYIKHTIQSIKKYSSNSKIYFCTNDESFKNQDVNIISVNELNKSRTREIINSKYYKNVRLPLWNTSMARVFAIFDVAKLLNIDEFVHFDNDVLIFEDFYKVKKSLDEFKGLHITRANSRHLVFGFSYINHIDTYKQITDIIYDELLSNNHLNYATNDKKYQFNEMYMMNIAYKKNPELINILPSLPFNSQPMLFDPGDYGIFLEGNDFNENISTITLSNDIGKYIYDNLPNIDIDFVSNKPFLVQNDSSYQIFNLHIHQKNLEKYSFN